MFFEKFRILEENDKSEDRVKNETENPIGFHHGPERSPKDMARELIECIEAVENESTDDFVYDTYPQVIVKLKDFLARDGVTKTMMCEVLGICTKTLTFFLSGENVYKGNEMYKAASLFFEKFRILEENDKSKDRVD